MKKLNKTVIQPNLDIPYNDGNYEKILVSFWLDHYFITLLIHATVIFGDFLAPLFHTFKHLMYRTFCDIKHDLIAIRI